LEGQDGLTLRVSVASLVRLLFSDPSNGRSMLAFERTATLIGDQKEAEVIVRAKPYGGAVLLTDPQKLRHKIGDYRYDSDRSQHEHDFRIQVHPGAWGTVKNICWQHLKNRDGGILDSNPERELVEEFMDTLHIQASGEQFLVKSTGLAIQDMPVETTNTRAIGQPTVRVYYLFNAWVQDPEMIERMLMKSRQFSDEDLKELAWQDKRHGGRGRANAILTLGLEQLISAYQSLPLDSRSRPIDYNGHRLDMNVLAILPEIEQLVYTRFQG
jgi:hypothetical protein